VLLLLQHIYYQRIRTPIRADSKDKVRGCIHWKFFSAACMGQCPRAVPPHRRSECGPAAK
jgi:hypothetical protein